MSIQELVQNAKKEEGRMEGEIEGRIEGRIEGIEMTLAVINLINEGKSIDFICEKLNTSEELVKNIKARIDKK